MKDYLLLLREENARFETLSPNDFEQLMKRFFEWTTALREAGSFIDCIKLTDAVGVLARKDTETREFEVVDGPFSEAREAIVGFYIVRARDRAAAQSIAGGCPVLDYGGSVEIREIFSILDK
ncbi:MAG: YciI family protein [Leptospirales bacterium]|jgi:hypothetical protein